MDYRKNPIRLKRKRRKGHYMSNTELFLSLMGDMVVFLLMLTAYILRAGPV